MDYQDNGTDPSNFIEKIKKQAKRILKISKNSPITISNLAEAQELIAQANGYPNWHALNITLNGYDKQNKKDFISFEKKDDIFFLIIDNKLHSFFKLNFNSYQKIFYDTFTRLAYLALGTETEVSLNAIKTESQELTKTTSITPFTFHNYGIKRPIHNLENLSIYIEISSPKKFFQQHKFIFDRIKEILHNCPHSTLTKKDYEIFQKNKGRQPLSILDYLNVSDKIPLNVFFNELCEKENFENEKIIIHSPKIKPEDNPFISEEKKLLACYDVGRVIDKNYEYALQLKTNDNVYFAYNLINEYDGNNFFICDENYNEDLQHSLSSQLIISNLFKLLDREQPSRLHKVIILDTDGTKKEALDFFVNELNQKNSIPSHKVKQAKVSHKSIKYDNQKHSINLFDRSLGSFDNLNYSEKCSKLFLEFYLDNFQISFDDYLDIGRIVYQALEALNETKKPYINGISKNVDNFLEKMLITPGKLKTFEEVSEYAFICGNEHVAQIALNESCYTLAEFRDYISANLPEELILKNKILFTIAEIEKHMIIDKTTSEDFILAHEDVIHIDISDNTYIEMFLFQYLEIHINKNMIDLMYYFHSWSEDDRSVSWRELLNVPDFPIKKIYDKYYCDNFLNPSSGCFFYFAPRRKFNDSSSLLVSLRESRKRDITFCIETQPEYNNYLNHNYYYSHVFTRSKKDNNYWNLLSANNNLDLMVEVLKPNILKPNSSE